MATVKMSSQAVLPFDLVPETELDDIMKTLEEDLPNCSHLVQGELFDDVALAGARDKTESVSSDSSLASFSFDTESVSSPAAKETTAAHDESNCEDMTMDVSRESQHSMVTRRRERPDYNLRNSSIINRIQTERRRCEPRKPKPKAKPPPLSKYRRRTANGRERGRMQQINDAFELLRLTIPDLAGEEGSKMTKITTLRLAMNYITALREMLGYSNEGFDQGDNSDLGSTANSDIACASPDSLPAIDQQEANSNQSRSSSDLEETLNSLGLFNADTLHS